MLAACASTTKVVEVPVDRVHIEREQIYHYDSIYINDSTITLYKQDTLFIERWRTRYEVRIERDTIKLTDTLTKVVAVEVPAEPKGIKWWQELICGLACLLVVLFIWKTK